MFSIMLEVQSQLDFGLLIGLIVLIFLSAFFSLSETAFSSANPVRLKMYVEDRVTGSKKALACQDNFERTLSTVLVGNNIVNITIATIAVGFFAKLLVNFQYVEALSTIVVTIIVLIFGEVTPKTIAKKNPDLICVKIGWIIYYLSYILFPIVFILLQIQKLFARNKDDKSNTMDEDELEKILDSMEEEGSIKTDEVNLIKNVFDLDDITVEDIMIPRIEMTAISIDASIEEVKSLMLETQFSRIPVYKADKDHIVGVLYIRDYFPSLVRDSNTSVKKLMRPVKYVSASMKVSSLMHEFRRDKTHIAIVSGEYGDTLGLVTMEDALEELVGEIYDEHDELGENDLMFKQVDDNTYIIDADMFVQDLFDNLDIPDIPEDIPNKVSSWIYSVCEAVPHIGFIHTYIATYTRFNEDEEEYEDYAKRMDFEIATVAGRRIETVKITITDASEEDIENLKDNED